ncbi:MAG: ABC transporter ATP-binding protein, partial [bacterium]|nr:ABC transporter ATP-binding protein [bacterium]
MSNVIEATGVRRVYGSGGSAFEAVRGVDVHLRKGELLAILGENGAGKTSLLELLEGMAPASGGEIRVFGKDPHRQRREVRPRTGIMLQEAGFAGDLTVTETLTMWAGTLTDPRPIDEALELVDLAHRREIRVKSLSGGERRRLDLAMATLGRPELLFLDEPTTGLDPASRERTWNLVSSMLEGGTTVLLTTHYLEEAEHLADRVVIMSGGEIAREGSVASIVGEEPSEITFAPTALDLLTEADL